MLAPPLKLYFVSVIQPLPFFVTVVSANAAHPQLFGPFTPQNGKLAQDNARFFAVGLLLVMQNRGIPIEEKSDREDHWQTKDGSVQVDVTQLLGIKIPE